MNYLKKDFVTFSLFYSLRGNIFFHPLGTETTHFAEGEKRDKWQHLIKPTLSFLASTRPNLSSLLGGLVVPCRHHFSTIEYNLVIAARSLFLSLSLAVLSSLLSRFLLRHRKEEEEEKILLRS